MMRDPQATIGNLIDKGKAGVSWNFIWTGRAFRWYEQCLRPGSARTSGSSGTTNTSSRKGGAAAGKPPKASLYFVDQRFYRGVNLTGTVEVLETPRQRSASGGRRGYHVLPAGALPTGLLRAAFYRPKGPVLQQLSFGRFRGVTKCRR